ncbi:sulfurtransferase [Methylophaga sp. 42_25_T18]|nr:sulfurtransferase [Methylophaga sp. 42_25_T18]
MKQMTVTELRDYLATGVAPILIDVRETHELQHGMLEGAIHIPMQTVPAKMDEFDQDKTKPVVLICRSGKRSDQVGQYLEQNGFSDVINLVGGMNAWAAEIDTSMSVY